jgi:hypothetical protein
MVDVIGGGFESSIHSRGDQWMLADVTNGVMLLWWDLGFLHDIPSHLCYARTRTIEAFHLREMFTSQFRLRRSDWSSRAVSKATRGLNATVLELFPSIPSNTSFWRVLSNPTGRLRVWEIHDAHAAAQMDSHSETYQR